MMKNSIVCLFLIFVSNLLVGQTVSESFLVKEFCFTNYHEKILKPQKFNKRKTPEQLIAHYLNLQKGEDLNSVQWGKAKKRTKGNAYFDKVRSYPNLRLKLFHKVSWKVENEELTLIKGMMLYGDMEASLFKLMIKKQGQWYFLDYREDITSIRSMLSCFGKIKTNRLKELLATNDSNDRFVNEMRKKVRKQGGLDISILDYIISDWRYKEEFDKYYYFYDERKGIEL